MMPTPGLQIYLRSPMTVPIDLLTPKVDRFMLLFRTPLVPICIEICSYVMKKYHVHKLGNRRMDEMREREYVVT